MDEFKRLEEIALHGDWSFHDALQEVGRTVGWDVVISFARAQQSMHLTKSRWAQFWDKLSAAFRR